MIKKIEKHWNLACQNLKNTKSVNWIDNLDQSLELVSDFYDYKDKKIIVGVSGPGASGKSTFVNLLCQNCNFKQLINVTTRTPRIGEINNKDYKFITLEKFKLDKKNKLFAVNVEKSGRGFYGIYNKDLFQTLERYNYIVIIESPLVISELFEIIQENYGDKYKFILLYFLPKEPITKNLIEFLLYRQNNIDIDNIKIEHGWRQIEEFTSLISIYNIKIYVLQGIGSLELVKTIKEKMN